MGAPRCQDCNKFVGLELGDPEIDTPDITNPSEEGDTGILTGSVRMFLNCVECGGELRVAVEEFEIQIEHTCNEETFGKFKKENPDDDLPDLPEFELDGDLEGTMDEELIDTDKNGKKIKNSRYMRKMYVVNLTGTVTCLRCGETIEVEGKVERQAGAMDDI